MKQAGKLSGYLPRFIFTFVFLRVLCRQVSGSLISAHQRKSSVSWRSPISLSTLPSFVSFLVKGFPIPLW
jgi:hypothetical protein